MLGGGPGGGPAVNMHPVQSSYIHSIGQDGDDLLVRFKSNDKTFRYAGGGKHYPPMRAASLVPGSSVGKYFHAHVKGEHQASEVK